MAHGIGVTIVRRASSWLYRVRDQAGNRRSKTFKRDQEVDGDRRKDGCAAGDQWAAKQRALYTLGQATGGKVLLADWGEAYAQEAAATGCSASYGAIIRNAVMRAGQAGIADLAAGNVKGKTLSWLASLTACRPGQRNPTPASPRLKNKMLIVLRSIAAAAVKDGALVRNPFAAVKQAREIEKDPRCFTLAELRNMVMDKHAGHHAYLLAVLAVYTGQRSETLRNITWAMVDWERRRIVIPGEITKQDRPVRCPIQPELAEILKLMARVNGQTIIPAGTARDSDHANEVFSRYLRDCKIPHLGRGLHVVRASHASLLIATGTSSMLVMDYVGWTQTQTMRRYVKAADNYRDQVRDEGWLEDMLYLRRKPPGAMKRKTG